MAPDRRSTPLISLEAVALDTEATELDARTARLVEIAILKIRGARILADDPFARLVNPGVAMPPAAAAVHGLTDADLRSAPRFAEIAAELDGILGQATVIGHDIGYDLTVLAREYALAGLSWRVPRARCRQPCAHRRADARTLLARQSVRLAGNSDRAPAPRDSRRQGGRRAVRQTHPAAARAQYSHAGGGGCRLPRHPR
jgi:DNA polymerase III epsilon subunit-like protein